ncbi:unnamed protein product [Darwinula stevensoni]|uniref:Peptidase S1 domain-containing protein n=1 Tax=Darwinula stevensoni TaxID=69355 RepID=A0A7R9AED0_9CRUS|nr:unnamed protein product [Darwinula stevensoni]CAG0901993.1 unnamed protein product [Darwinula stevensoni]
MPETEAGNTQMDPRIIGGSPATITEAPWVAYITILFADSSRNCTGVIIDQLHVLTAATCVTLGIYVASAVKVAVGNENYHLGTTYNAVSWERHPSFLNSRGCPGATVRVWESPSADPAEDCGENSTGLQFVSEANTLRLMFITADKAVGAQGFQAIWTEIKDDPHCDGFHCSKNGYCISDNLRCNGYENCGVGDKTDELNSESCASLLRPRMTSVKAMLKYHAAIDRVSPACLLPRLRSRAAFFRINGVME